MKNASLKIILTCMTINIAFGVIGLMYTVGTEDPGRIWTIAGMTSHVEELSEDTQNMTEEESLMSTTTPSSQSFIDTLLNLGNMIRVVAIMFFGNIIQGITLSGPTMVEKVGGFCIAALVLINNYLLFKEFWLLIPGKQRD